MDYKKLCEVYERLEQSAKRLQKTFIISEFLKSVHESDLGAIMLLLQGSLYPAADEHKIGVASKLLARAIAVASGVSHEGIITEWKKTGDLGIVSQHIISKKSQSTLSHQKLSVRKVFENLKKLAEIEGAGTVDRKIQLIAELLTSASPLEAKYICRTILGELRVGVGAGVLRDSIVWVNFGKQLKISYDPSTQEIGIPEREAYTAAVEAVQRGFDLSADWGMVAVQAQKGLKDIEKIPLAIGVPIKCMLAIKVSDIDSGFEEVGEPAAIEYKYDGLRLQIHKNGKKIRVFTRRLEDVTRQFPDVVDSVSRYARADSCILDSEAVGYDPKTRNYVPFQHISQRIKRKHDIELLAQKLPVEVNVFDILYLDGKNLIEEPFAERRKMLKKIIEASPGKIVLSRQLVTDDREKAQAFYEESLKAGNEGVMMKAPDAPYKPGARVGYMVKLKSMMETLDLVIVGAEWGEGKRSSWLSSFTLACESHGKYIEVGKVGTGIKEKEEQGGVTFAELTALLKPLIIEEKGTSVRVRPRVIVEVSYEEIQKSPTYGSGYALRFPRVVRLREDKSEVSSLALVERLYKDQKKT